MFVQHGANPGANGRIEATSRWESSCQWVQESAGGRSLDDGKGDDDNDGDGNGDVDDDDDDDHRQELRQEEAKRHQGEQDEMGPIRIRWKFY